jgi:hypothetical protein
MAGIGDIKGDMGARMIAHKATDQTGQHVIANGEAGPDAQLADQRSIAGGHGLNFTDAGNGIQRLGQQ